MQINKNCNVSLNRTCCVGIKIHTFYRIVMKYYGKIVFQFSAFLLIANL